MEHRNSVEMDAHVFVQCRERGDYGSWPNMDRQGLEKLAGRICKREIYENQQKLRRDDQIAGKFSELLATVGLVPR